MTETIIYDSGSVAGHNLEYIEHLMCFLNEKPSLKNNFVFILNPDFASRLDDQLTDTINIIYIPSHLLGYELKYNRKMYLTNEKKIINHFLKKLSSAKQIFFNNLDPYQSIILSGGLKRIKISGILYQPYIHVDVSNRFVVSKELLRKLRKKLQLYIVSLFHKESKSFFILNDELGVAKMNKTFSNFNINFRYLPDPTLSKNIISEFNPREYYNISTQNIVLLIFGVINDKKNILNILDALKELKSQSSRQLSLIVAGKFSKNQSHLRNKIDDFAKNHSEIQVIIRDEFIDESIRNSLFSHSDIILMPYVNFYSSSGILGHSVLHSKPVVASNLGLIARLVKEYSLGFLVDPFDSSSICEGIKSIIYNPDFRNFKSKGRDRFLSKHSVNNFASTVLLDNK